MVKKQIITKIKQSELEDYTFLDIDDSGDIANKLERMLEHLNKEHNDFFVKLSTNNNLHVIVKDVCPICMKYNDSKYDGTYLFLNKGTKFSNNIWRDKHKNRYEIESTTIYHFFIQDMDQCFITTGEHSYHISELNEEKIEEMFKYNRNASIHLTFHKSICKEIYYRQTFDRSSGGGSVIPFEDYINLMNFVSVDDMEEIKQCVNEFDKYLKENTKFRV